MKESNTEFIIGWHIGEKRRHEKDAYCLMRVTDGYIMGTEESIHSLEDKVKYLAKKHNAVILKQTVNE